MKSLLFIFLLAACCAVAVGLTREYIFRDTYYSWDDAQTHCRKYYKDLATITTKEENDRLLQLANVQSDYYGSWIGLKLTSQDVWTWSDEEQTSFLNLNDRYGTYDGECAAISTYQGLWWKFWCKYSKTFYCYRSLILINEMMTWERAHQYCRTHFTGLASMISEQINLETVKTQTESVWTGLRYMDGQWFWVSGELLGSLVSMPSLCPAQFYRCGALDTTTNTVKIHNCNDMLNFVCYWSTE